MRKRPLAYRLRRAARRLIAKRRIAEAKRIRDFERQVSRALFGADQEPSWDDIRNGARAALLGARGTESSAVRRIWEGNTLLPPELRKTAPGLLSKDKS